VPLGDIDVVEWNAEEFRAPCHVVARDAHISVPRLACEARDNLALELIPALVCLSIVFQLCAAEGDRHSPVAWWM
jgi:hypothetical protein